MPKSNLLLIGLLCTSVLAGCSNGVGADSTAAAKAEQPALVRVAKAELRMVRREIRTTGFLESEHQAAVTSRVAGRIRELAADEGTRVKAGALLAAIDDREAQSALEQLRVQLGAKSVDKHLAELEVEAAGRRVQQAKLESQKTKAEYDRQASMEKDFVSPKALQDAQLAWLSADQAFKVAEFNERKSNLEVTRIDSDIAELTAKVHENEIKLEDLRIVAPFDGVVVKRYVASGTTIAIGAVLFDMVDPDHLVAWLDRPQGEFELVRKAREVEFTTDAVPGRNFTGDVDLVSPVIERDTGHFRMRIRIRPADTTTLVQGMFIRARILAEELREALVVPKTAVLSEGDVSIVMVVRDGKATRVDLDPGLELQDAIECRNRSAAGLRPGDLVITSGQEDLKDQSAVRVAKE
jgi:membrane fusion protein, multidrug efflux system